jgi:cytochrome c biogenesis protein CcmG/thiol:disulfide interchange protein DsbE
VDASIDGESSRSSRSLKLLAGAVLVTIVVYAVSRPSHDVTFTAQGNPLSTPPAGQLTSMSEAAFEGVLVGLRGKPVIVNIWASWCAPCRTETPLLERTWKAHHQDVTIIGVASRDIPSSAEAFMREFSVSYPNVFDVSGDIRARLGLRGFPTTYVFGADGTLRTTIVGGLTEQRLAAVLEDLGA